MKIWNGNLKRITQQNHVFLASLTFIHQFISILLFNVHFIFFLKQYNLNINCRNYLYCYVKLFHFTCFSRKINCFAYSIHLFYLSDSYLFLFLYGILHFSSRHRESRRNPRRLPLSMHVPFIFSIYSRIIFGSLILTRVPSPGRDTTHTPYWSPKMIRIR